MLFPKSRVKYWRGKYWLGKAKEAAGSWGGRRPLGAAVVAVTTPSQLQSRALQQAGMPFPEPWVSIPVSEEIQISISQAQLSDPWVSKPSITTQTLFSQQSHSRSHSPNASVLLGHQTAIPFFPSVGSCRCHSNNPHWQILLNDSRVYFNILYSQHWSSGISYNLT